MIASEDLMKNSTGPRGGCWCALLPFFFIIAICFVGCAGRAPHPVALIQPQDQFADCATITAEIQSNNFTVQQLANERGWKTTQNVAAGVAGVFIPVLWFGLDFQGAATKEMRALEARQRYLARLLQKRCR